MSFDDAFRDEDIVRREPFFLRRRRDKFRKKLDELLARADDELFLRMIWAADAVEDKKSAGWAWFTKRPEDLTKRLVEGPFFHKWTLETLANEVLGVKKTRARPNRENRNLDCRHLWAAANAVNLLNELENAEDGMVLRRVSVLSEMHRLAQRQFPWQRGKVNKGAFFKAWYLYGFPEAEAHFLAKHGVSLIDFSVACFGLYVLFQERSGCLLPVDLAQVGISDEVMQITLRLISRTLPEARILATEIRRRPHHTSYRRSVLRETPLIRLSRSAISPVPDLIIERITSGIYYDIVDAGGAVRDKVARRFESYCIELIRLYLPAVEVVPEFKYKTKDSPDAILLFDGKIRAAVECKAKKEPVSAKFGEEEDALSSPGIDELSKGVFQLWRFFAHVRMGLVAQTPLVDSAAVGILLMLDTWLEASEGQRNEVLRRANELADASETDVLDEDRKPVAFCHVDDLESLLMVTTEADFWRTLKVASQAEHQGWHLRLLHEKLDGVVSVEKPDPFQDRMEDTVKWFSMFSDKS